MELPKLAATISPLEGYDRQNVPDPHYDTLEGVVARREDIGMGINALADQIAADYEGREVVALCVLEGARKFYDVLVPALRKRGMTVVDGEFDASSYEKNVSTGKVTIDDLDYEGIDGKEVLVVEDIVDTGLTMIGIVDALHNGHDEYKPTSVKVATLINRPAGRSKEVKPQIDYSVLLIPPKRYLMGIGLDSDNDERTRDLLDLYALKLPEDATQQTPTQPQAL